MGGRVRDPVYAHITLVQEAFEDGGKMKSRQQCMHCGKTLVFASVGRLRAHLSGDEAMAAADSGGWGGLPVGAGARQTEIQGVASSPSHFF